MVALVIYRFRHCGHGTTRPKLECSEDIGNKSPETASRLMCRSLVSVAWDGELYDCDFNQMPEIGMGRDAGMTPPTIWQIESFPGLAGQRISTGDHCFGCTAGSGSSCGGALA